MGINGVGEDGEERTEQMGDEGRGSPDQSGKEARFTAYQNRMIAKWRGEIDQIKTEVIVLYHNRDIYNRLFEIVGNNPRIQKGNSFYEWMHLHYVVYASIAIRRLLDNDSRAISLRNLISSIGKNRRCITREWYASQFSASFRPSIPRREFDDLVGDSDGIIDSQRLLSSLEHVQTLSEIVIVYANKLVAHADSDPPDRLPRFDELDTAIDAVGTLFRHLYGILNQTSIRLELVEEFVWEQLFEEPWIVPRDGLGIQPGE